MLFVELVVVWLRFFLVYLPLASLSSLSATVCYSINIEVDLQQTRTKKEELLFSQATHHNPSTAGLTFGRVTYM